MLPDVVSINSEEMAEAAAEPVDYRNDRVRGRAVSRQLDGHVTAQESCVPSQQLLPKQLSLLSRGRLLVVDVSVTKVLCYGRGRLCLRATRPDAQQHRELAVCCGQAGQRPRHVR